VLIGVTLEKRGLSGSEVGVVLGAMLAGSVVASLALGRVADRLGRRRCYLALLVAMGLAGSVFALTGFVPALVLAGLTGALSTDVVESGPFTSLEQAMLPHATRAGELARLFGTYNSVATVAGSAGALVAAGPALTGTTSERWLLAYPVAAGLGCIVAFGLTRALEVGPCATPERSGLPSRSRPAVIRLSSLFALDSFGGGFVVQAFIAYWLTRRFDTSVATLGVLFFAVGILQALSFQAAGRLAARVGLLNTMVFTHLPSNLLLGAIAFAPNETIAIVLLLARFGLSQMDVPARQAYVVALVDEGERTAAAAFTNAARSVPRPLGPVLAGTASQIAVGLPFLIGAALKTVYDVGLYALFRGVELTGDTRPPRG
jgi:MFS family permease